jgi:hypothetical protein
MGLFTTSKPSTIMLITDIDLKKIIQVSEHTEEDKINTAIKEAERFDLKDLLGEELFWDLINNTTQQKYIDLLDGKSYTNKEGNTVQFEGVKIVISYFASARLLKLNNNLEVTRYGTMVKLAKNLSQVPDPKMTSKTIADLQSIANEYFKEIEKFLDLNKEIYPLWKVSCSGGENKKKTFNPITKVPNKRYKFI